MKRDVRILVLNLSGMGMGEEMALEVMTFHRSMEKVFPVFFGCVIFTAMGVFQLRWFMISMGRVILDYLSAQPVQCYLA